MPAYFQSVHSGSNCATVSAGNCHDPQEHHDNWSDSPCTARLLEHLMQAFDGTKSQSNAIADSISNPSLGGLSHSAILRDRVAMRTCSLQAQSPKTSPSSRAILPASTMNTPLGHPMGAILHSSDPPTCLGLRSMSMTSPRTQTPM